MAHIDCPRADDKRDDDFLAPADPDSPAFTEEQARAWLAEHGKQSVRSLAKVWGWNPTRVHRFIRRETPGETPAAVSETPVIVSETVETPAPTFDWGKAQHITPNTFAYVDDNGRQRQYADMGAGRANSRGRGHRFHR
jgi:hypothetical protein